LVHRFSSFKLRTNVLSVAIRSIYILLKVFEGPLDTIFQQKVRENDSQHFSIEAFKSCLCHWWEPMKVQWIEEAENTDQWHRGKFPHNFLQNCNQFSQRELNVCGVNLLRFCLCILQYSTSYPKRQSINYLKMANVFLFFNAISIEKWPHRNYDINMKLWKKWNISLMFLKSTENQDSQLFKMPIVYIWLIRKNDTPDGI
jgi:hypothetical protein